MAEQRYTFGPLYAPDSIDAHGEYTDAVTLTSAAYDYALSSAQKGRRLNLQHDDSGAATAGAWAEVVSWPFRTTVSIAKAGENPRTVTVPAGTVFMGVVWDDRAWPAVKAGKIGGLSLGGRALRVSAPATGAMLPAMGDMLKAADLLKAAETSTATVDGFLIVWAAGDLVGVKIEKGTTLSDTVEAMDVLGFTDDTLHALAAGAAISMATRPA